MVAEQLMTSASAEYYTPDHVLHVVYDVLGSVDLDPCSNPGVPNVKATRRYTSETDGLASEWSGNVFMNPPYGRALLSWATKMVNEFETTRVSSALVLVPARTDTKWWSKLTAEADADVCFIKGRLQFKGATHGAPFPSALVLLTRRWWVRGRFYDAATRLGPVWSRVPL